MHILQVHNFYQQSGGEDIVVASEEKLLLRHGHDVHQFTLHNEAIPQMAAYQVAIKTLWNDSAHRAICRKIEKFGIDVVHVHNTFPLISPAIYYAAQVAKVPVVQTLHNYRLLCPAATLYRAGAPCEKCVGKFVPWPAIVHGCYRASTAASAMTALMLATHRAFRTYSAQVNVYIAASKYSLDKFVQGGLPRKRLTLKTNFVIDDPGIGSGYGGYALFAGRLAPEKGLRTLLKAWAALSIRIPLKIAGDGPLRSEVESLAQTTPNVEYLGFCSRPRINELMRNAALLVFPSEWYEVSPLSVMEAMASGTPVLASDRGSLTEMIVPNQNGLLFPPGDVAALAATVETLFREPDFLSEMRYPTRQHYEANYASEPNYKKLMAIYKQVTSKGERYSASAI